MQKFSSKQQLVAHQNDNASTNDWACDVGSVVDWFAKKLGGGKEKHSFQP